jgi:hypothetical protein
MEKVEKDSFKDFWVRAHMGVVVFNPTKTTEDIKPLESYNTGFTEKHAEIYGRESEYKAFGNGGIFGNGPVCDAVMFSILF